MHDSPKRRQAARLAKCSLSSDQLNGELVSLRELAGEDVLVSLFWAEVPLDRSKAAKVVEIDGCTANMAKLLLDTWLERRLDETLRLWPRYNLVKKIAMRSAKNPWTQADEVEPSRNEACPCGSGRKHKDCCGREQVATNRSSLWQPGWRLSWRRTGATRRPS